MVSLKTLCKERPGLFALAYGEVAAMVRKHSAAPLEDVRACFRLMVFNAAIGNTDDHLKNFWMLCEGRGFRLAPAIDLVPDVGERREHALAFLHGRRAPSGGELLALARAWGVKDAAETIARVTQAARGFPLTARRLGVPAANVREIGADVADRVERLESRA
jgi:serine/threonine-protein kinase HipA